MGQCNRISEEIINKVLSEVFPKKRFYDKSSSTIDSKRPINFKTRFNYNPSIIINSPPSYRHKNLNFEESIPQASDKLYKLRKGPNCHFCGEIGHIKKTCLRK